MNKQADLRKWFKEKWVDISRKNPDGSHPECGRDEAKLGKKGYPKCRPKAKAAQMTKKEKSYAVRAKRSKRQGVGGKPTMVPTEKPEKQTKTAMNLFDHFQGGLEKIAAGGFRKAFDPLRDPHSYFTYFDGDRNIHDDLTRQQVYERYLKEKPENRVDVARNMAHNTSYLYRMQEDHGLRGRLLARKHGKHVEASNRLLGHEDKPGGHVAADAYMKKHFGR